MRKIIKFISISFLSISAIMLILLFLSILRIDYQYAHKSLVTYQQPFNWAIYKLEISLLKFIKKLKN